MSHAETLHDSLMDLGADAAMALLGRRLRDTLDNIREIVFQIDSERVCQFLNSAWGDITGQCISETIGTSIDLYFWSEDQERARALLVSLLQAERETDEAELRLCRRDGSFVWVELRARVVKNDTGDVIGLSGTMLNITDRRHAEGRLRQSESLFRAAFDLSPNGIAIYASDGKFRQSNVAMCQLFGYSPGQLLTKDVYALVQPDDISQLRKAIRRAMGGTATRGVEMRGVKSDGTPIWVEFAASLLNAGGDEPSIVLMQFQDLSERKKTETDLQSQNQVLFHAKGMLEAQKDELDQQAEQLQIARQLAEDANRAKTDFLANMSHEIRTPMTAIIGYSELLLDAAQSEKQRLDCVNTIRRSGQHLLGVVNDILDIAKIESGRLQLELADVRIEEVVGDVVSLMRGRAHEKGVDFTCDFSGPVPRMIRSDQVRLRQILLNLVGNAIKFTERGAVRLTVDMGRPNLVSGRRFLRLIVEDSGIGMSNDQLARMFLAFEQADISHTRKFGGTGLGLVITRRLVDMLGGTIEVTSQLGAGTTFVVTLDVETDASGETEIDESRFELPKRPAMEDELPVFTGRVLLAEDGKDNQRLISFLLRRSGLEIAVADNGAAAIDAVKSAIAHGKPFDLVLMDMQMPEMDGYAATKLMRDQGMSIPVIALTAHAMAGDRERCIAAGCSEYLTKPLDRRALVKLLARFLQGTTLADAMPVIMNEPRLVSRLAIEPEMKDILAQYVSEMPNVVGRIQRALSAHDFPQLQRLMHELKGSAGGYGFDEITALASAAEASIRLGADGQYVDQSVQQVVKQIRRIDGYADPIEVAA